PPAKVFRAHTDPELVAQWLGPRSLEMKIDHYECRTGGSYRYLHLRGDEEYGFRGCFHEVRPPELIVQTFTFEGVPDSVALDTLAHIPPALLFPAPRMPAGHVLLGYDENGCCPMLVDGGCSIYDHRPRTCRTYDCRVFPAAGIDISDDGDKGPIAHQARRWRF